MEVGTDSLFTDAAGVVAEMTPAKYLLVLPTSCGVIVVVDVGNAKRRETDSVFRLSWVGLLIG